MQPRESSGENNIEDLIKAGNVKDLTQALEHADRKVRFRAAVALAKSKYVEHINPLSGALEHIPLIQEKEARNCGQVYHDGEDLFKKPFDAPILPKTEVIHYIADEIFPDKNEYIYSNNWEPDVKDVNGYLETEIKHFNYTISDIRMKGSVLIVPFGIPNSGREEFYIVRTHADGFICYKGTTAIRPSAGAQNRIPKLGDQTGTSKKMTIEVKSLMYAIDNGEFSKIKALLNQGVDVNEKSLWGISPLMSMARLGHIDIVELLLEKGADVNAIDNDGATSIMFASQGGHVNIIETLLARGADINARAENGMTALLIALRDNHLDIAKILIDKGADVNANSKTYGATLHFASSHGNLDIIKILLDKGANINVTRMDNGWTPLMNVSGGGYLDCVKLLLANGANVNAKANDGTTALIAASTSKTEVVKILLANGADINAKTDCGETALHEASDGGNLDIVKMLLEKNANINPEGGDWTPLITAVYKGHLEVVKMLLDGGADITAKDNEGCTAMTWASHKMKYDNSAGKVYEKIFKLLSDYSGKKGESELSREVEFSYKCHKCSTILSAGYSDSGTKATCVSCGTRLIVPSRIGTALKLLTGLEPVTFEITKAPPVFYHVPIEVMRKLLAAFDVKEHAIDYFIVGSQEVQIPGTKTIFVMSDRSNTLPLSEGRTFLGEPYLRYHLYFIRDKYNDFYCFGDNEIGGMLDQMLISECLNCVINRLNANDIDQWDESSPEVLSQTDIGNKSIGHKEL